ncbi:MAG: hypothetical protein V3T23_03070 [Nitrososphaerales archaeon]
MNDQRDEKREETRRTNNQETAASLAFLQEQVESLETQLGASTDQVAELQTQLASPAETPAGDDELRGLAATYRVAVRNGHPDAAKHLESILRALGA